MGQPKLKNCKKKYKNGMKTATQLKIVKKGINNKKMN